MPIVYALVSDGTRVLAEHSTREGNFKPVARQLLAEIPRKIERKAFSAEDVIFSYMADEAGLVFMCMTTVDSKALLPWVFMEDVKARFLSDFPDDAYQQQKELGLNDSFGRVLAQRMEFFNSNPITKTEKIREELKEVKDIMRKNIETIVDERGNKLTHLLDETERLDTQSVNFVKKSKGLKWKLIFKNIKLMVVIVFLLIYLLLLCIVIIVIVILVASKVIN